jgi:hypothetical protein
VAESAFLHGPKAQNRPGSFSSSKLLIVGYISGHGKKFAVAAMGEVREDRVPGVPGIIRFFEEYAIHAG